MCGLFQCGTVLVISQRCVGRGDRRPAATAKRPQHFPVLGHPVRHQCAATFLLTWNISSIVSALQTCPWRRQQHLRTTVNRHGQRNFVRQDTQVHKYETRCWINDVQFNYFIQMTALLAFSRPMISRGWGHQGFRTRRNHQPDLIGDPGRWHGPSPM